MKVFRIEKNNYLKSFPPEGSKYGDGRWHNRGMWVVYSSESIALAKLEAIANGIKIPVERSLVEIEISDSAPLIEITIDDIPKNWKGFPYPPELAQIIKQLIKSQEFVAALVPSAQSPREQNILLFPDHPDFKKYVKRREISEEYFDHRLK